MTVAVVSVCLGGGGNDRRGRYKDVPQNCAWDRFHITEREMLLRVNAMTPRLQAKIPRYFAWELFPGYDYYICLDSDFLLARKDSVEWFVRQCEGFDIAAFFHPNRHTIQEEFECTKNLVEGGGFDKYKNEFMEEQVESYLRDSSFMDNVLYALGAFIYRNDEKVHEALKEGFYHCARYSIQDQLSFPYVIRKLSVHGLNNLMENKYLQWYPTNYDVMCIKERQ